MSPVSQRRLLLADDSVTIQKVVNLTFADEGIEVITVGDGDAAMEKFSEFAPDLVMADVNMPGLSGYEVCEKIRQSSAANTPVILLVGSFEPFDESEADRVGANDHLTKPFQSIRQLVNKVTELLHNSAESDGSKESGETEDFSEAKTLDSFSVPSEYASSQSSAQEPSPISSYDDIDDEMIESSSGANAYVFDESAKFQTREVDETPESAAVPEFQTTDSATDETEATSNQEQDLAAEQSTESVSQPTEQAEDKQNFASSTSNLFADDDDLLEIYFDDEEESEDEEESSAPVAAEAETSEAAAAIPQSESVAEHQENALADSAENAEMLSEKAAVETPAVEAAPAPVSAESPQLSPEMIDAIAQRVVEKLSDRAVKEVAWEVVPQHAELIIKKMVEEKMKE